MKPTGGILIAAAVAGFAQSPLQAQGRDPREGKVQASTFVASSPNASTLGHGSIVLAPGPAGTAADADVAAFEPALVEQLAKAGYRTEGSSTAGGQVVEYVVSHAVVAPPEPSRGPISGGVSVGVGNHGWSGLGLGIGIDLSKPRGPLVATRLEARIRDAATKELLWQGRAEVIVREGDRRWTPQATAARLSATLFKGFPRPISF